MLPGTGSALHISCSDNALSQSNSLHRKICLSAHTVKDIISIIRTEIGQEIIQMVEARCFCQRHKQGVLKLVVYIAYFSLTFERCAP